MVAAAQEEHSAESAILAVKVLASLAADDASVCDGVEAGLLSVLQKLLGNERLAGTRVANVEVLRTIGSALLALVTRAGTPPTTL